jgi:hypothetical protein
MKDDKSIIKYEKNIFERIIDFFKSLFNRKENNIVREDIVEENKEVKIVNSMDQYKVNIDENKVVNETRMNELMQKYLDGTLDEDEMTLQEAFVLQEMVNKIMANY